LSQQVWLLVPRSMPAVPQPDPAARCYSYLRICGGSAGLLLLRGAGEVPGPGPCRNRCFPTSWC